MTLPSVGGEVAALAAGHSAPDLAENLCDPVGMGHGHICLPPNRQDDEGIDTGAEHHDGDLPDSVLEI